MARFTGFSYDQLNTIHAAFGLAIASCEEPETCSKIRDLLQEVHETIEERDDLVQARPTKPPDGLDAGLLLGDRDLEGLSVDEHADRGCIEVVDLDLIVFAIHLDLVCSH